MEGGEREGERGRERSYIRVVDDSRAPRPLDGGESMNGILHRRLVEVVCQVCIHAWLF